MCWWMGLQSELEDLCFAVMHPREYRALRSELDTIWGLPPLSPTCIADAADKALTAPATPPKSDPADDSPAIPTGSITVSPPAEVALPSSSLQTFASSSGTGVSTPVASSNILSMPGAARRGTSVQEGSAAVAAATTSSELTVGTTECSSTMSSSRGATVGSVSQVLDSGAATVGAAMRGAAGEPSTCMVSCFILTWEFAIRQTNITFPRERHLECICTVRLNGAGTAVCRCCSSSGGSRRHGCRGTHWWRVH
jgi:hypothetical protein